MESKEQEENYTTGYIKLYRSVIDHWLWIEKPFSKFEAWVFMLLRANHSERKVNMGFELFQVNRGQFITSQEKLSEQFGWGRKQVRSFLDLLKADGMILIDVSTKMTKITICNYDSYQDVRPTKDPHKTINRPSTEQQQNNDSAQTSNSNNAKNGKKVFVPPSLDDFKHYFVENGFGEDLAERAWRGYAEAKWHDSQGKPIKNWRQKCLHVWFKDSNRSAGAPVKITKTFRITDFFNYSDYKQACGPAGITPLSQPEFEEAVKPKAKIA